MPDAMSPKSPLGFVILSHQNQEQLVRLIATLNRLYCDPPIACHHDRSQSPLDPHKFPGNVRFVEPSLKTGWAKWSVVEAFLMALALLYKDNSPDWFVLLSAADYPVMPAEKVVEELANSPYDAYLDARQIGGTVSLAEQHGAYNPQLGHFDSIANQRLKWSHCLGAEIWLPAIRRTPRWRLGRYTVHLPFAARNPFKGDFYCFYGDHWFTANRKVAGILLNPTSAHLTVQKHLKMRTLPDECYYQTILCNTVGLSICRDNKRFTEWNGGGAHPMYLTENEIPFALSSGAHFARKFALGSAALDKVDQALFSG